MQQSSKFNAKLSVFLTLSLLAGVTSANQIATSNTIIHVDLGSDSKQAHAKLQYLKNMDVLGVNLPQHWADASVTTAELAQLRKQNIHFTLANNLAYKATITASKYLNPDQVIKALGDVNSQYPTLTKLFEAGKTHRNRSIMALEISAHLDDPTKPVVLFNGMHHAREVMTPEVVLHIAKVLTEKYGNDNEVTNWLDNFRIIILPQVNPDGNAIVNSEDAMWRKNAFELNGSTVGVDLNRNYPAYWNYCNGSSGYPDSQTYRGPSAGSEPETQTVMNLVSTLKPVADISYHSYSELIIYPFGCSSVKNPSKDLFRSIGQAMNLKIRNDDNKTNSYALGTAPELLYEADGSDLDWQWKEYGVFAYTIEVNASSFMPDYNAWRDVTVKRQEGAWKALLNRMLLSGFRGHVQTSTPDELRYSLQKVEGKRKFAFDADAPDRTFPLRSKSGLLYQLTEKGKYELSFVRNNTVVKTITIDVGDKLVDMGDIEV